MNKLDVRRMQMLSRQRQKLEDELAELQAEVDSLVCPASVSWFASPDLVQELSLMRK